MVQRPRLHASNAGGPGSIPGQGTRSHMPQLRVPMLQLKIPHAATKDPYAATQLLYAATEITCAATKTRNSQINK